MLGKKQNIKNDDWLKALSLIESTVSRSRIEALTVRTISDIKRQCSGKRAAYAWSGGKDSIVLGHLCERAGVKDCVMVVCNLEYKAFTDWVKEHSPERLEIINTGQDLKWLSQNLQMLFPQDSATAAKWFHIVQHRGQALYYKKHKLDIICLGRRKADGNYVGRGSNIYTNAEGVTRYSPISDWTHEEVLAYIHYHKLLTPPPYTIGATVTCVAHTNGLRDNGQEASKTDGERYMKSIRLLWNRRLNTYHLLHNSLLNKTTKIFNNYGTN